MKSIHEKKNLIAPFNNLSYSYPKDLPFCNSTLYCWSSTTFAFSSSRADSRYRIVVVRFFWIIWACLNSESLTKPHFTRKFSVHDTKDASRSSTEAFILWLSFNFSRILSLSVDISWMSDDNLIQKCLHRTKSSHSKICSWAFASFDWNSSSSFLAELLNTYKES